MVWFHHERPDGQGPLGLSGDAIPLPARIVAVAGAVEAMSRERPHRPARSCGEIIQELQRCQGTQFDPAVTQTACRRLRSLLAALPSSPEIKKPPAPQPGTPPDVAPTLLANGGPSCPS